MTRAIAAATVATGYFEKSCVFNGQAEISPGAAFARHQAAARFGTVGFTTSIRNFTLRNVVIDANSFMLFQDGQAISETDYLVAEHVSRQLPDRGTPTPLRDDEDVVVACNNAHWGYQHWLTQCMPAIDWTLRQKRTRNVRLLLPPLQPWQDDLINLLGYRDIPRLTLAADTRYHLPRAEYSEFLNGTAAFGISLSGLATAQRILRAVPPSVSAEKVIYVPCANPYYGSIVNERAVIALLLRRGVHIVDQQRLSTAERLNLFRHADVVIGPHGQGLSDVLFCRPGTLLWEWMPQHHCQNCSYNRLAQAAQVDYWADVFDTVAQPETPPRWEIDLDTVTRRLAAISGRFATRAATSAAGPGKAELPGVSTRRLVSPPIDEMLLRFESLGDNCEFGLVQQIAEANPLGLLRFTGVALEQLLAGLDNGFEGLGTPGTVQPYLSDGPAPREFMVHETACGLNFHTFVLETEATPGDITRRVTRRLGFLRRKLLEDLANGEKVWVWRCNATLHEAQIRPLLDRLRRLGPNILLWVGEADADHAPGTIEPLERDFIKGYVKRFAILDHTRNIDIASWFEMCWRADEWCHPHRSDVDPEAADPAPPRPLTAIDYLSRNPARAMEVTRPPTTGSSRWPVLGKWLRRG